MVGINQRLRHGNSLPSGKDQCCVDAISRKIFCNALFLQELQPALLDDFKRLNLGVVEHGSLATLVVQPTLVDRIKTAQQSDVGVSHIKENVKNGTAKCFSEDEHGVLRFGQRLVVPKDMELRELILREAHDSHLSIHPGATKMYQDLRQRFWWTRMKREVAKFVAECDVCRRVKAEHQRPAGLLQPLPIPEWKWDSVGMDFITGLPRSPKGNDAIWEIGRAHV